MSNKLVILFVAMLIISCSSNFQIEEPKRLEVKKDNGKDITIEYCNVPFKGNNEILLLEGLLYINYNLKKWPGIVMTHGRRGPRPARDANEVYGYYKLNMALAEAGYAVLFLVRRGYGRSQGTDSEFLSTPAESGLAAALDIKAGVAYLREINGVLKDKTKVIGHSQGGWVTIGVASTEIDGVIQAINISGGTNYKNMGFWGYVNEKVQIDWINGAGELGSKNRIPMIWIYSENDRNHPSEKVKLMFQAFERNGGVGKLYILPPYKDNGHMIVNSPELFLPIIIEK